MKRSSILLLGGLGALVVLSTTLAVLRVHHVAASAISTAVRSLSTAKQPQDSASGDPDARVVRFARNPSPMPPFLVSDLSGRVVSTAALRGKVVLLNFWATWCPPCRDEIPEMIELANRYKDRLAIVGVSMDDSSPSEVAEFVRTARIDYPVVMGDPQISDEYGGVPALPTSFVIDTDGNVVQKHMGLFPIEVYDNEIRALLGLPVKVPVETFEDTGQIFLKNASRATELPGIDFSGLTPDEKRIALKRMNTEFCTCGCKLTIAQCRISEDSCSTSQALAAKIIQQIVAARKQPRTAIAR
jgi:thiol-disulfide isomerase/thioredoxin